MYMYPLWGTQRHHQQLSGGTSGSDTSQTLHNRADEDAAWFLSIKTHSFPFHERAQPCPLPLFSFFNLIISFPRGRYVLGSRGAVKASCTTLRARCPSHGGRNGQRSCCAGTPGLNHVRNVSARHWEVTARSGIHDRGGPVMAGCFSGGHRRRGTSTDVLVLVTFSEVFRGTFIGTVTRAACEPWESDMVVALTAQPRDGASGSDELVYHIQLRGSFGLTYDLT